jgi:hypothetical protein
MDEFNNPFWSLDEVFAWAETRDPDMVRFAGVKASPERSASSSAIATRCLAASIRRMESGRDVNEELWQASGLKKPNLQRNRLIDVRAEDIETPRPFQEGYEDKIRWLADNGTIRVKQFNPFPTRDYILRLLQDGTLKAVGAPPGNSSLRPVEPIEFQGTEIAAYGPNARLAIWRRGKHGETGTCCLEHVQVPREDVIRFFPAEAPSSAPNLESALREARDQAGPLTQVAAVQIARQIGATDSRQKIRATLEAIQGPGKPGPKGPRKTRAAPTA